MNKQKALDRQRERRRKLRLNMLCRDCGAPTPPGKAQCEEHLAYGAAAQVRSRNKKKPLATKEDFEALRKDLGYAAPTDNVETFYVKYPAEGEMH